MFAFLIQTTANFVATAEDFSRLSSEVQNYMSYSVNISNALPQNLSKVNLDCLNNTVFSSTQPFDAISWSSLLNCVFVLESAFANRAENVEIANVTFIYTSVTVQSMIGQVKNSLILGVRARMSNSFIQHSSGNRFIGMAIISSQDYGENLAGFVHDSANDAVLHCSFHTDFLVRAARNVGGLFSSSEELTVNYSRLYSIVQQYSSNKTYVGGISANSKAVIVFSLDMVMKVNLQEMGGYVGGIIGLLTQGNAIIQRASVATEMHLESSSASNNDFVVGSVIGRCMYGNQTFQEITVYTIMDINSSQSQKCLVGGAFGDVDDGLSASILYIYVFGEIKLNALQRLEFGGIIAEFDSGQLNESVFNGEISVDLGANSSVAGVVAFLLKRAQVHKCQAHGSITGHPRFTTPGELFVGGLIGYHNLGSLNLSYSNLQVVLDDNNMGSNAEFFVGMLVGNINNSATIENCFALGYLECTIKQSQLISGQIAVLAGQCVFCTINNAFSLVNLQVTANPTDSFYAGTIAGLAMDARISNVFIKGGIRIFSQIIYGSIVGYVSGYSEFKSIAIMVQAYTGSRIPYTGLSQDSDGFDRSSIAINIQLGFHEYDPDFSVTSEEMRSESILSRLGGNFMLWQLHNDGFPYLEYLPIPQEEGFLLADEGFDGRSFYLDDSMFPFLKINFSLCQGACFGNFVSPVEYLCSQTLTNMTKFCVCYEEAEKQFPDLSCMWKNAYCADGVSGCKTDSELIEFECEQNCPDCQYGHCTSGICSCAPYYSGGSCSTPDCQAVDPVCFAKPNMDCSASNECACPDQQYYKTNDGCFLGCPGLIASHGSCIADGVAECINYWLSADGGYCNVCDDGYVLEDEICVNNDSTCYNLRCAHGQCYEGPSAKCQCHNEWVSTQCEECKGYGQGCDMSQYDCDLLCQNNGYCAKFQTDICTCPANYAGKHCDECAPGYFLQGCMSAVQCGTVKCSSHGYCQGSAAEPTCDCANQWEGTICDVCGGYGPNCDKSAAQCVNEYCDHCADKSHCQCVGSQYAPLCECIPGWYSEDCGLSQDQCNTQKCSGHGICDGGITDHCACDGHWLGVACSGCLEYGSGCNMSEQACQEVLCDNGGECKGFGDETRCVCFQNYDPATNCSSCLRGYEKDGLSCVKESVDAWLVASGVCGGLALLGVLIYIIYYCVSRHRNSVAYAKIEPQNDGPKATAPDAEV